jgi:hypothetical protein
VCQGELVAGQVQADELYVKMQHGTVWIATAMCVFSRLFIWGEVGAERNTALVQRVVERVRAALKREGPLLWVTDGFGAWAKAVAKVFRDPVRTGKRGRPCLQLWPELSFVQVVKHKAGKRLISISHRLLHGSWDAAYQLVFCSQTQLGCFNTAYVERLNASLRTWLPALTRRSRTPARTQSHLLTALFWTGCVYNFCQIHALYFTGYSCHGRRHHQRALVRPRTASLLLRQTQISTRYLVVLPTAPTRPTIIIQDSIRLLLSTPPISRTTFRLTHQTSRFGLIAV